MIIAEIPFLRDLLKLLQIEIVGHMRFIFTIYYSFHGEEYMYSV